MNDSTNIKMSEQFRNGVFRAASRTYGEKYMEPIIRKIYNLDESKGDENDAIDTNGIEKEIKASKVLKSTGKKKNMSTLEKIIYENNNDVVNRLIPFEYCFKTEYLSNIQNVKRDHFNQLIYVLLFQDCIKIFVSDKDNISNIPNWCDKHGRYDELGKSGQFPINKNNIKWHIENNLKLTLTWDEVYETAKTIK